MKVITTEKIPIKMWLGHIDDGAMEQARNLANLPFAFKHIAIMPDAHCGYGMPIGGVLATKGVVVPGAVGVDIGCGMLAAQTPLQDIETLALKTIMGRIRETIPVGFEHHKDMQDVNLMPYLPRYITTGLDMPIIEREYERACYQIGTLGGGNHFIELQKGSDGHIWIMIHSGSRNLGKQVADHYNNAAARLNDRWFSQVPTSWQLAFLPHDSDEGQEYLNEMNYCVSFALANRKLMMDRIVSIIADIRNVDDTAIIGKEHSGWQTINIAHNYACMENHFGNNVVVHRKGATLARDGQLGVIPGSQGTKSYIVKGKGNKESFESCSHGAGRKMGRKEAERTLDLEKEIEKLDNQGILHAIRGIHDLDEASGAYKSIDEVMENQKDLVDILVELTPLGVIKG